MKNLKQKWVRAELPRRTLERCIAAAMFVALIAGCGSSKRRLTVTGASTLLVPCQEAGWALEDADPELVVLVQPGGTTRGIQDTASGNNDVGMASRELTPEELERVQAHSIALDAVALVVHRDNPVRSLSTENLRRLYAGEIDTWDEFGGGSGPVRVVHKADGHATQEVFLGHVELARSEVRPHVMAGDNSQVLYSVAADRQALGYVSWGEAVQAVTAGEPVRVIALDGVPPTIEGIAGGSYPMSRPLSLLTREEPSPDAEWLIQFFSTDSGRAVLEEARLVPLR